MHRHFRGGRTDKVNPSQPCTETIPESDSIVGNTDLIRAAEPSAVEMKASSEGDVRNSESAGYRVLKAGTMRKRISFDEYKTIVRLLLTESFCRTEWPDLATDLRSSAQSCESSFSAIPKMLHQTRPLEDGSSPKPRVRSIRKVPQFRATGHNRYEKRLVFAAMGV